jgi:hypothetical protein
MDENTNVFLDEREKEMQIPILLQGEDIENNEPLNDANNNAYDGESLQTSVHDNNNIIDKQITHENNDNNNDYNENNNDNNQINENNNDGRRKWNPCLVGAAVGVGVLVAAPVIAATALSAAGFTSAG